MLEDHYFASQSELFLPVQSGFQKAGEAGLWKGKAGQEDVRDNPLGPSQAPAPLLPPRSPGPPLRDPGQRFFSNIPLERVTKVFSLVLLSCDQSIAQEMGSLQSCLSKISHFTSWNILREHSAPSLPRANISVTCVLGARLRPHILCLGNENTRTFLSVLVSTPPPLGLARRKSQSTLSQEV